MYPAYQRAVLDARYSPVCMYSTIVYKYRIEVQQTGNLSFCYCFLLDLVVKKMDLKSHGQSPGKLRNGGGCWQSGYTAPVTCTGQGRINGAIFKILICIIDADHRI